MNRPSRRSIAAGAVLGGAVVLLCVVPLLVASGVRGWLWWHARQEGLTITVARIEAPLLRPVVLHQLHITSADATPHAVEFDIDRAEFGLDLRTIVSRSEARRLRDLSIENAHATFRKTSGGTATAKSDWRPLRRLFADSFRISHFDLRIENGDTIVNAFDVSLTASEIETGTVTVREIAVASPLVRKRFTELRGATSWQNQRLSLGAITLTRGIDIDAITVDFSHLALQRIGLELNVDVFGGKVRANVTSESRANRRLWDVAGTARGISLAQMSETIASSTPASGTLRACKFTFRGDTTELMRSTASVWLQLDQLNWNGRAADTIMLGASIYNRRLHLEQLYVKQDENQLTLSADSPLTLRPEDWVKPGVNVDISANVKDVDELARLFGAAPNEYSGELTVEGTLGIEERKRRAALEITGQLQLRDARLRNGARVTASVNCTGSAASIENVELTDDGAVVGGRGEITFADLREVHARFVPAQPAGDTTAVPTGACVNGFSFATAGPLIAPNSSISEIDVRGGLFARDWAVSLIEGDAAAPEQRVARTFQLCPATTSAGEVRLTATATAR